MDKELLQYVNPQGPLPEIAGTKDGPLLIVGTAMGVWNDLRHFDYQGFAVMAINDMMWAWPKRLDHGATLHPEKLPGWSFSQTFKAYHNSWPKMLVHSHLKDRLEALLFGPGWVTHHWPIRRSGGTSGLFGTLVGLLMGYDRIILAGIPCDDSPRFFDDPMTRHEHLGRNTVFQEWEQAAQVFNGRVKSLSGRTCELLGAP